MTFRSRKPGDIGYIIYRHGVLYAQEYGFDDSFDLYVGKPLIVFAENFDPEKENLWIAEKGTDIVGSLAIVNTGAKVAQLRWLLVEPAARGLGIGQALVERGVAFCRTRSYKEIFLWTIDYLGAAKKIYTGAGFKKTDQKTSRIWGQVLTEERWELQL
ncbi:MAG: GNAT family N-acetyltransferase [Desulfobacterales bacterium]|nr:GNAT family N-acetyltransferase [Desulfobacterales bacterium]